LSNMLNEALSSPEVVTAQLADNAHLAALAEKLARQRPHVALTVARGSSDHAASYFASLAMSRLGVPVASLPMSVATLQQAPLQVKGELALAFSQSGRSPDLVGTMTALRAAGARTVSLVNAPDSPLAAACEWNLPLRAGPELSVAATKSYIAMLSLSAQLVALWQGDDSLSHALNQLPQALHQAGRLDWSPAVEQLREVDRDYPLLVFAPRGPEQAGLIQFARDMQERGARVLLAAPPEVEHATLPLCNTADPALDPIAAILTFYVMAACLATVRGRNPDTPRHLSKVTETH